MIKETKFINQIYSRYYK